MSSNVMTTGDITVRQRAFFAKKFLETVQPVLVLGKLGAVKELPTNSTKTMSFRRRKPFAVTTVPLVEGVTPTGLILDTEDVEVTINQYGAVMYTTDMVGDTSTDEVLMEAAAGLGEHAASVQEQILYGVVKAGTVVSYTNGAARASVNTPITVAKLQKVTQDLKVQKADKISKTLSASADFGTSAIQSAYVAVVHTLLEYDIRGLPGFVPTVNYGTKDMIGPQEFGSIGELRFMSSPDLAPIADGGAAKSGSGVEMISTSGTSADVFPILIFGKDAFASVPLQGRNSVTPMVLKANTPRGGDPLGQRGSIGYKMSLGAVILNQTFMARIECAATKI